MDTLKINKNTQYYDGYEDECDVIITILSNEYHIWEGYFDDIFGNPIFSKNGWYGFTRDYNELTNCFDETRIESAIMPEEYLRDLIQYGNHTFEFSESYGVLKLLITIMSTAKELNECVFVRVC